MADREADDATLKPVHQEAVAALLVLVVLFCGGVLTWWLMDVLSRSDIGGVDWTLRGYGALIVPIVCAPMLIATGWALLRRGYKGDRVSGPPTDDAGARRFRVLRHALSYLAVPVVVAAGFMASVFFGPPVLAVVNPVRSGHTATLLANGRVLIAGGLGDHGPLATSWLYDPDNERWSRAPDMAAQRVAHTATRMHDSRVLVAGASFLATDRAGDIYDPARQLWAATPPMPSPRFGPAALLLDDGRVMVAGGGRQEGPVDAAQLFDASTGSWSVAADVPRPGNPKLLRLQDGTILGVAGTTINGAVAYTYDAALDRWSLLPAPPADLGAIAAAVELRDGRVFVLGGELEFGGPQAATLFDPARNTWSSAPIPSDPAFVGATATVLDDGRVLLAGGSIIAGNPPLGEARSQVDLFNPASGTWSRALPMLTARAGHSATLLNDGRVLLVGGSTRGRAVASAELFDPGTGTWRATADISS